MKRVIRTIWRWFVSWNVGLFSALISLFAFRLPFLISFLIGGSIGIMYSFYMKKKEEKHYPSKDDRLKEAKKRCGQLDKVCGEFVRLRCFPNFRACTPFVKK